MSVCKSVISQTVDIVVHMNRIYKTKGRIAEEMWEKEGDGACECEGEKWETAKIDCEKARLEKANNAKWFGVNLLQLALDTLINLNSYGRKMFAAFCLFFTLALLDV